MFCLALAGTGTALYPAVYTPFQATAAYNTVPVAFWGSGAPTTVVDRGRGKPTMLGSNSKPNKHTVVRSVCGCCRANPKYIHGNRAEKMFKRKHPTQMTLDVQESIRYRYVTPPPLFLPQASVLRCNHHWRI